MSPAPDVLRKSGLAAPAIAAALLGAIWWSGGIDAREHRHAEAYFAQVASAVDALPYRIGRWVGVDSEPSPSGVKLLRPNRILQRRYMDPATGDAVSLLIVHCGDVRDMLGHYPPMCYPAHGWRLEQALPAQVRIEGRDAPARLYRFSRTDEITQRHMSILNFFILPNRDVPIAADMDTLERASGSAATVRLGAAQIQILRESGDLGAASPEVVEEFVRTLEPIIREVVAGGEP